ERLDAEAREAELAASGQETRGKGGADMRMKSRVVARGPNETEVSITSDVNVVGVLAQFGRGMIQDVSDQMFQKFADGVRRELETTAAAPAPAAASTGDPPPAASPSSEPSPAPAADPAVAAGAQPLAAAPVPPAPAPPPAAPAPLATSPEAVLDVGAIGAKAAGRAAGRL